MNENENIIEVTEAIEIEEGKQSGKITNVTKPVNTSDYEYIDIYVTLDKYSIDIKTGFPAKISDISAFGRFLKASGLKFKKGDKMNLLNIKEHLLDKKITFLTKNEKTEKGKFARVLRDTIEFVE